MIHDLLAAVRAIGIPMGSAYRWGHLGHTGSAAKANAAREAGARVTDCSTARTPQWEVAVPNPGEQVPMPRNAERRPTPPASAP